jgi:hypothetical protein
VLDGVCVVWASLLDEALDVVYGRPHLALAAACGNHDAHHAGATHFLIVATVVIGRGCDRLKMLLAPLLATHDALLGILDGNVR